MDIKDICKNDLLIRINSRDILAFSELYQLYYSDFYYFTKRLFNQNKEQTEDVLQDIFMNIWENKKRDFTSISGLKLYIYVCIKNRFRNHLSHQKHIDNYLSKEFEKDKLEVEIIETEALSELYNVISVLPKECAKVFKLHLEGWNVTEIAQKLNKAESTVYRQRQDAIKILRKKLYKSKFYNLISFLLN